MKMCRSEYQASLLLPSSLGSVFCVYLMSVRWFGVGCQGFSVWTGFFIWQGELFLLHDPGRFSFSSLCKWWTRNMALKCQRSNHNTSSADCSVRYCPQTGTSASWHLALRGNHWVFSGTSGKFVLSLHRFLFSARQHVRSFCGGTQIKYWVLSSGQFRWCQVTPMYR